MKKTETVRGWIKGVDNVSQPDMVGKDYLVECNNMHLDMRGVAFSRKGYDIETVLPLGWYSKEDCAATTGWSLSTDGDNITTDTTYYVTGYSSLEFDKTGTSEAYVYAEKTLTTGTDWGRYNEAYVMTWIPTGSNISTVTLLLFSNTSNYYYETVAVTEGQWNKVRLVFSSANTAGTPTKGSITKVRVKYNTDSTSDTATDIYLDALLAVRRSEISHITDFITTDGKEYNLVVADGNIWKKADTDINGEYLYVSVYSGFEEDGLADSVVFNDKIYFVSKNSTGVKYDGSGITPIGFAAPSTPGFNSNDSGSLNGSFYYVCTYYNSATGHESAPSAQSSEMTADGTQSIIVNLPGVSSDSQVDKVRLYRRSVYAGNVSYLLITTVDVDTATYEDDTSVEDLASASILKSEYNQTIQSNFTAIESFKDRLVAVGKDGYFYYSRNLQPESWSPYNALAVITEATQSSDIPIGISKPIKDSNAILVFTRNTTHMVVYSAGSQDYYKPNTAGFNQHPFRIIPVSDNIGCVSHKTIKSTPYGVIWLATDGVYVFDGASVQNISQMQGDNENSIVSWFDNINLTYAHKAVAIVNNDYYRVSLPEGDATSNSRTFEINLRTGAWTSHDLPLQASYVRLDSYGTKSWYHSAEKGEVTFESGFNDNGSIYESSIKTGAFYYGTTISPRRVDLITNGGGNTFSFRQYCDLGTSAHTYDDGNDYLGYTDSVAVTRVDTDGFCKFVQFKVSFTPDEQVSINGFNHEFEVRYNF